MKFLIFLFLLLCMLMLKQNFILIINALLDTKFELENPVISHRIEYLKVIASCKLICHSAVHVQLHLQVLVPSTSFTRYLSVIDLNIAYFLTFYSLFFCGNLVGIAFKAM